VDRRGRGRGYCVRFVYFFVSGKGLVEGNIDRGLGPDIRVRVKVRLFVKIDGLAGLGPLDPPPDHSLYHVRLVSDEAWMIDGPLVRPDGNADETVEIELPYEGGIL